MSNDLDHPDYVPTITKAKPVSLQLSLHKAKRKNLSAVDRMSRRLKRTQERDELLLTQQKCKNPEQDENNVTDELKSKNCA